MARAQDGKKQKKHAAITAEIYTLTTVSPKQ
jgi:hypothetical protein